MQTALTLNCWHQIVQQKSLMLIGEVGPVANKRDPPAKRQVAHGRPFKTEFHLTCGNPIIVGDVGEVVVVVIRLPIGSGKAAAPHSLLP